MPRGRRKGGDKFRSLSSFALILLLFVLPMLAVSWRQGSISRRSRWIKTPLTQKQCFVRRPLSSSLLYNAASSTDPYYEQTDTDSLPLQQLLQELQTLNNGQQININSHKQVSTTIFGQVHSTSRQILDLAAEGKIASLTTQQQRMADLVRQYRKLAKRPKQQQRKASQTRNPGTRHFSSSALVGDYGNGTDGDEIVLIVEEPGSADVGSGRLTENEFELGETQKTMHYARSPFEKLVDSIFEQPKSKLDPYWKEPLKPLTRPTAQALVSQLDATQCPMGYDPLAAPNDPFRGIGSSQIDMIATKTTTAGKKGSFLAYCREQKEKHPDVVILTRCGDFYETYGLDAILLVEYCGLNAMAGKAKAGCPIRNVQATLDGLTSRGFRVAVYEEALDTDASKGPAASGGAKSRIKNRFLAQIVSAASPTYLYDLVLLGNMDLLGTAPPSRPYVGVLSQESGYTLVEISVEEQSVRVSDRMTAEAVACRMSAYPPADPLIYIPSMAEYTNSKLSSPPFLPSRMDYIDNGPGARLRTHIVSPSLVEMDTDKSDLERAKSIVLSELLRLTEGDETDNLQRRTTVNDFTLVNPGTADDISSGPTVTHSLHRETATQLGLMNDKAIPSLVTYLLPESAPAATRRYLRRNLLTPPKPAVANAMRDLVAYFKDGMQSMPPLNVPPLGKVLSLLRAGQASADVYRELIHTLSTTVMLLESFSDEETRTLESLMRLIEFESGIAASPDSLCQRCKEAISAIEATVCTTMYYGESSGDVALPSRHDNVPTAFFERNELAWRGRIRYESMPEIYERVQATARCLAKVMSEDFADGSAVVQDIFNNILALREVPKKSQDQQYFHPRDRFGKAIRNRYTTERVQEALSNYVDACENAKAEVSAVLTELSKTLHDEGHMPAIVQASHTNLVASAAFYHASKANILGWNLASSYDYDSRQSAGRFVGLWPYWMDRREAVANSFDLDGMWILTAPNMAGKSTILRSTAAASLLTACGLCAPLDQGSSLRRFDHIFVRGASSDVPTENKSAFGAEMGDVAALFRSCGERSLVFVDELARGTSPRDGTVLAAAVLEEMASKGMNGVFATHLHDLLDLPLQSTERIVRKMMDIRMEHAGDLTTYQWTFHLVDGVCKDSLALQSAKRFGVPQSIIERAGTFQKLSTTPSNTLPSNFVGSFADKAAASDAAELPDGVYQLVEATANQKSIFIPRSFQPPASLEGTSCVYVLSFPADGRSSAKRYYIGETDNFRLRLKTHRAKGGVWAHVDTIVIPIVDGKTEARALESLLIRTLAKAGVDLVSKVDGRVLRHGNRSN